MTNQTKYILVTRPAGFDQSLCEKIEAHGHGLHALHLPTIAFAPPKDEQAFLQAIKLLPEQEWIIFVSQQAVGKTITAMQMLNISLPQHIKIAAIGGSTAKALQAAGFQNIIYPEKWDTENLLALPAFQHIEDVQITIIKGEGGRELLEKMLVERGAQVESVIAYRRIRPTIDINPYLERIENNKIQAIICLSFESVNNLQTLLNVKAQSDLLKLLKKIPLIVPSHRIKRLAGDLGFQTICVAQNGSDDALLAVISSLFSTKKL